MFTIAFNGVRISWLTMAKNWSLCALAFCKSMDSRLSRLLVVIDSRNVSTRLAPVTTTSEMIHAQRLALVIGAS